MLFDFLNFGNWNLFEICFLVLGFSSLRKAFELQIFCSIGIIISLSRFILLLK
ncbi:hypothetical protein D1AOALGA4SA_5310 [Olavius algarvensis Delta 1 endosymbiont]|nr:hypothetical protein D1AOALGA4SA_5310 [Olavius algarvensis Delta 1 endosymbiont]